MVFYIWGGRIAIVLVLVSIVSSISSRPGDRRRATRAPRPADRAGRSPEICCVLIIFKYARFHHRQYQRRARRRPGTGRIPSSARCRCRSASRSSPSTSSPIWSTFIAASRRRSDRPSHSRSTSSIFRSSSPDRSSATGRLRASCGAHAPSRFADVDAGIVRFAVGAGEKAADCQSDRGGRRSSVRAGAVRPADLGRLARGALLRAADLFRFLRLLRHGDRNGAHVRLPLSGKFQLSVLRHLDPGILATLAHHAVGLVSRLCLYSARRQPRRRLARPTRNLWIVFLLCGAWHGASWNFVVWGMWHGLFLSIERIGASSASCKLAAGRCATSTCSLVVMVGWVFFRVADARTQALDMLTRMFGLQRDRRDDAVVWPRHWRADDGVDRLATLCLAIRSGRSCASVPQQLMGDAGRSNLRTISPARPSSVSITMLCSPP